MALLEIDEIVVNKELWELAQEDNHAAKSRLREQFDKVVLYNHIYYDPTDPTAIIVTLRDLEASGIIKSVTMHREIM